MPALVRALALAALTVLALAAPAATAAATRGSHTAATHSASYHTHHRSATSVARNSHGRKRSIAAKDAFKRSNPCPSTGRRSGACPGYVIDHVIALKRGGADAPGNMQWQTIQAAKAKDKVE